MSPDKTYRDLVTDIPAEYIISSGHDDEGLDFLFVSHVIAVSKYTWSNWVISFECGTQHPISVRDWRIMEFRFDTKYHTLMMGFVPELDE
jgi:hypothetical protein